MSTQLFLASTAFGLATLVAALAEGHFDGRSRGEEADCRILVLSNNAAMPEGTPGVDQVAGWDFLHTFFDDVVDHNATLAPLDPVGWVPRSAELPLWERHLRGVWGIGSDEVHLVLESIQASPALALARIFADASIDVYADGLMSYGPTRTTLPEEVGWRVERLLHLDLVPDLTPMLLTDWGVPATVIGATAFRSVISRLESNQPTSDLLDPTEPVVMVVGQYLAAAGLLSEAEELELYRELVVAAGRRHRVRVLFKPHPSAPRSQQVALRNAAAAAGVPLEVCPGLELAESRFATGSVVEVAGCFSTALATAANLYDIPVSRLGTELVLGRLTPFHNSNRIPATIIDAMVPGPTGPAAPITGSELADLVTAVGYTMQPTRYADRRAEAVAFLTQHPELHGRYFKRRRLTRLGLPGRLPRRGQLRHLGRAGLGQLRARVVAYTGSDR